MKYIPRQRQYKKSGQNEEDLETQTYRIKKNQNIYLEQNQQQFCPAKSNIDLINIDLINID